jgi:hypothetical protein
MAIVNASIAAHIVDFICSFLPSHTCGWRFLAPPAVIMPYRPPVFLAPPASAGLGRSLSLGYYQPVCWAENSPSSFPSSAVLPPVSFWGMG